MYCDPIFSISFSCMRSKYVAYFLPLYLMGLSLIVQTIDSIVVIYFNYVMYCSYLFSLPHCIALIMSTESRDLVSLVEKLRQEQEFVFFYKSQIRQGFQELNANCDDVFHSLWLSHTLSHGLQRVLTHHVHCYEWSLALDQEINVEFINASKALQSHTLVEPYSKFLTSILSDPRILSEILYIAESEGLDCQWLVSDLMSVVFGHCIFEHDHTLFLQLLRELIKQHIQFCDSPKDLFGGVESVFNKVLAEYCAQLVELQTFLTELLQEPVMEVLMIDDYLEYDVHKAGSRFQTSSDQAGSLVDTRTFLFGEDLDTACEQLARIATLILEKLSKMSNQFPLSLKWLLTSLKSLAKHKWPEVTQAELRRLTSDAIFGTILSSAIVNPDNHAIVESSVVVTSAARYNLTQVTAVLQRTAWKMDKQPINKVIKRIDMVRLCLQSASNYCTELLLGAKNVPLGFKARTEVFIG